MSTVEVIKSFEAQVKSVADRIDTELAEWQASSAEERTVIETRLRGLEEVLTAIKAEIAEKERFVLPGSEPSKDGKQKFSLGRAAWGILQKDFSNAGYEKEVFDAMREKEMSSGVDGAGGFIVPDEAIPQVIERLKAQVVAFQLGAREMTATGSPIMIPRIGTSVTAAWMTGENTTITASDLGLEQIAMTPKTLASRVIMSNQLLELSMPTADSIIEGDMVSQLAIGLDQGIIEGSGAVGEPLGIVNDPNVLTEVLTAAQVTFAQLVGFVDALAVANSLRGNLGWAMHPSVFTQIMKMPSENAATPTANLEVTRHPVTESAPDSILGYPFATTTSFSAATGAKSVAFGNWDDVLVAMWGGLRLKASDVADSAFSTDQTHIRGIMRADTVLRHPESFVRSAV